MKPNILFITLDQFRADCLSVVGHPVVKTPNLDALAESGVLLVNHYSQAAPCAPGRAALYTGTYQMNNRVVANGTPLDHRFDNIALAAQRAGYRPVLFGYTDQGVDPRQVPEGDPMLSNWEGVLPGFECVLDLAEPYGPWIQWLKRLGYDIDPAEFNRALTDEPTRPAEHSQSAFLTDELLAWIGDQHAPWFAHASYLRPHPPFAAAGDWAKRYDPADVALPMTPVDPTLMHPLHRRLMTNEHFVAPSDEQELRVLIAQYYGMVSEVDSQLGRVWSFLVERGLWENTFIVVTADHAEHLGDQGLTGKGGFFGASYHQVGIVRDPQHPQAHGTSVKAFTENVDLFPTLCDAMGIEVPAQCDGLPLTSFLRGEDPPWWRDAAHWEFDWRSSFITDQPHEWPWDRRLERQHLSVRRSRNYAYVQFGDGSWRCFDLALDPTWRTETHDPAIVLAEAQAMLTWRSNHADRTLTDMLLRDGGIGRVPVR
jgi:arylsulfatase A-like enzyme